MNRQLLINRLAVHVPHHYIDLSGVPPGMECGCRQEFLGEDAGQQWARHVASVIYPETAGVDRTALTINCQEDSAKKQ